MVPWVLCLLLIAATASIAATSGLRSVSPLAIDKAWCSLNVGAPSSELAAIPVEPVYGATTSAKTDQVTGAWGSLPIAVSFHLQPGDTLEAWESGPLTLVAISDHGYTKELDAFPLSNRTSSQLGCVPDRSNYDR